MFSNSTRKKNEKKKQKKKAQQKIIPPANTGDSRVAPAPDDRRNTPQRMDKSFYVPAKLQMAPMQTFEIADSTSSYISSTPNLPEIFSERGRKSDGTPNPDSRATSRNRNGMVFSLFASKTLKRNLSVDPDDKNQQRTVSVETLSSRSSKQSSLKSEIDMKDINIENGIQDTVIENTNQTQATDDNPTATEKSVGNLAPTSRVSTVEPSKKVVKDIREPQLITVSKEAWSCMYLDIIYIFE